MIQHFVQVGDHLLQALALFGRHVGKTLRHVAHGVAHGLLLEHLHELIECLLRLRVEEVVGLQGLDAAGKILRQLIHECPAFLVVTASRLAGFTRCLRGCPLRALLIGPFRCVAGHLRAVRGLIALTTLRRLAQRLLFLLNDIFQTLFQLVHERCQVVSLQAFAALLLEAFHHLPNALETAAHAPLHAALHQIAQRLPEVAVRRQVVRHGLHQVFAVDRQRFLRSIPA